MIKIQKYDVFFDNAILKNLLNKLNVEASSNFKKIFSEKCLALNENSDNTYYCSTPIMLTEYVGAKMQPLSPFDFPDCNFRDKKSIESLFVKIKTHFDTSELTDYSYLMTKLRYEEQYRDSFAVDLANEIFGKNLENINTRSRFIDELVLDEIQGFYSEKSFDEIKALMDYMSPSLAKINFSMARLVHAFFEKLPPTAKTKHLKDCARQSRYDFSSVHQDRLDTQLVHYAVMGRLHQEGSRLSPVLAFTTENIGRIKDRCNAYMAYLDHKSIARSSGIIFQVNCNTGEITNESKL